MAELKHIDEMEQDNVKQRNIKFDHFPLEQFTEVGKVDNEGDPHLKATAETELYEYEKCACNDEFETDDLQQRDDIDNKNEAVSHLQPVGKHTELDENGTIIMRKCYGPVYVPYKEDGRKILMPQMADMLRKDNLKLLSNTQPLNTCTDQEYEYLENAHFDTETFQYSHEALMKQIMVQGVYISNTSPLVADIKSQPYSIIQYADAELL